MSRSVAVEGDVKGSFVRDWHIKTSFQIAAATEKDSKPPPRRGSSCVVDGSPREPPQNRHGACPSKEHHGADFIVGREQGRAPNKYLFNATKPSAFFFASGTLPCRSLGHIKRRGWPQRRNSLRSADNRELAHQVLALDPVAQSRVVTVALNKL
jgi:hypothetical protein